MTRAVFAEPQVVFDLLFFVNTLNNFDSMDLTDGLTVRHRPTRRVFMAIRKELLEILACPQCKGEVKLNEPGNGLICQPCQLMYEIKDDIPIMLIEKAKKLP
jgi:hypothetical protein